MDISYRIHIWIARFFLAGLTAFFVYYPYKFLSSILPFAFSGPTSWQGAYIVEDSVLVPLAARLGHFVMWLPTMLATQAMILASMWLVILLLRGIYFEPRTVGALSWVGGMAFVAGSSSLVAQAINPWLLTLFNSITKRPIRVVYDSGEIGVALVGLGLFLLGRVLQVSVIQARENKEFV